MYYPHAGGFIDVYGPVWGLIDHCIFSGGVIEHAISLTANLNQEAGTFAGGLAGSTLMASAYQPGTINNTYIEDNTVIAAPGCNIALLDTDGYCGTRAVIRHNKLTNALIYNHWTRAGSVNSAWLEVYDNEFDWTLYPGTTPDGLARLEGGGTGLFYNNIVAGFPTGYNRAVMYGEQRLTGSNSGAPLLYCNDSTTHVWDGDNATNPDAAAPGWPCLAQTGRASGITLNTTTGAQFPVAGSFPLYIWSNGPQCSCQGLTYPVSGSSCISGACDNSLIASLEGGTAAYFKGYNYVTSTGDSPHSTSGFGNGDYEYCIYASQPSGCGTHTLTYTAYTYPHPLQVGGTGGSGPWTVTPSAGSNGTISPNTAQSVANNGTTTFTVTPSSGYTASVSGTCGGTLSGTTYTTNAITGNCTVVASFASSGGGGSSGAGSSPAFMSGTIQ
jgi:hypothetical protein